MPDAPPPPAGLVPEARLLRERRARQEAERLLEEKSRELFLKNQELAGLAAALEVRVAERTAELQAALVRAEAASRAKSEFLASMSHELRTPLNAIIGLSEQLLGEAQEPHQEDMVRLINRSSEGLLGIINDVLDFSQIEAGRLTLSPGEFDAGEVVAGAVDVLAHAFAEKGLGLGLWVEPGLPPLVGDPVRVRQVALNFLGNALKFTEAGRVDVSVRRADGLLRVEVRDTGIGIGEDRQGEIFQPFTQLEAGMTRRFGGTGLGLSICRKLAEAMGGTVGFASSLGQGSAFWVELPLPEQPAPAAEPLSGTVLLAGLEPEVAGHLAAHARQLGLVPRVVAVGAAAEAAAACPDLASLVVDATAGLEAGIFGWPLPLAALGRPGEQLAVSRARAAGAKGGYVLPLGPRSIAGLLSGRFEQPAAAKPRFYDAPDIATARAHGALVLAVEDNPVNQTVLARMLAQMGIAHEMAGDGVEALGLLARGGHGLVLTDLHMPNMDGIALARAIRAGDSAAPARLPILALTADAFPATAAKCREAGMDGVLTKPLRAALLERQVGACLPPCLELRRPRAAPAPAAARPEGDDILDTQAVMEATGLPAESLRPVLDAFMDSSGPKVADLTAALMHGRMGEAAALAHFLRGAATNIGANRLAALLLEVDRRAQAGDEGVADRAWDLQPAFDAVCDAIRERVPA